jgi:hypothetical protein
MPVEGAVDGALGPIEVAPILDLVATAAPEASATIRLLHAMGSSAWVATRSNLAGRWRA